MGMMDDLQKRLEKFGKDVERSVTGKKKPKGGHTLGGAADSAPEHAFDASRPLGMTLTKADDGRAEVTGVAQQGQAESKAVRIGDVVAALDGAATDYDGFVAGVAAARSTGARMRVRFARPLPRGAAKKAAPLSNEQRDARRDAMARAAEKRGQPAPRKKKAADAPKSPTVFEDGPRSAETQAAWERAQRGDVARSTKGPRCTRWLMLGTLYRSGGGTMSSRRSASVAWRSPNRSWMHPRYSACADVHTAAQ